MKLRNAEACRALQSVLSTAHRQHASCIILPSKGNLTFKWKTEGHTSIWSSSQFPVSFLLKVIFKYLFLLLWLQAISIKLSYTLNISRNAIANDKCSVLNYCFIRLILNKWASLKLYLLTQTDGRTQTV